MALPGTPAKDLKAGSSRLKLLLYGDWKVGKTHASCQFPDSFFIDTEKGATKEQYIELLKKAGATRYDTNSFEDVIEAVRQLTSEKHDRKTLVVDPVSTLYSDLLEVGEAVKGDDWGRHYGYADQKMKRLFLLIDRLDMNCIFTSAAKDEYKGTGTAREATGKLTPDAWKKLPYAFDLIIELRRRGNLRQAEVRGSRLAQFPEGETFEWSYEEFVKRLGAKGLEHEATPTALIDADRLRELTRLLDEADVTKEARAKMLRRAKVTEWTDVSAEDGEKMIAALEKKIKASKV